MTLTTHSIIAAAITKPLGHAHPVLIFALAIFSHYLSDAIPHWDYKINSVENLENPDNRRIGSNRGAIKKDIIHFTFDGLLGAAIVIFVIQPATFQQWAWALAAITGGCLPDFLQGLYVFKIKILRFPQRFHDFFHSKICLSPYPLIGIPFQAVILFIALYALF